MRTKLAGNAANRERETSVKKPLLCLAPVLLMVLGSVPGCGDDDSGGGASSASTSWSAYNLDDQNSRHNQVERELSRDTVAGLKPLWRIGLQNGLTGTPAVVDGIVYFNDWDGNLYAVRADDGEVVWRQKISSGRSSVLVDGDRLYVTNDEELHARNLADGEPIWTARLDTHPATLIDSSPVIVDGLIIIGVAGFELVLQREDYTFRGSVVAIDAETGSEVWRVLTTDDGPSSGAGVSVWSSAAIDRERHMVFIGTGNTYEQPASPYSDALLAIDYQLGELVWSHQFTADDVFTTVAGGPGPDWDIGASPNLFTSGGRDVVGVGDKGGSYRVFERDTGAMVWRVDLTTGSPIGGVMASAAVGDGVVYVNSNEPPESTTFALSAEDGSILWEQRLGFTLGALTLANGVLYQPSREGIIYAFHSGDGSLLWSQEMERELAAGISVVDGRIFVGEGFTFLSPPPVPGAAITAFSLSGTLSLEGTPTITPTPLPTLTNEQCQQEISQELPDACRDCACACNPSAAARCNEICWEVASCARELCADADYSSDEGRQCLQDNCNEKLLPAAIFDALVAVAPCAIECDACAGFQAPTPTMGSATPTPKPRPTLVGEGLGVRRFSINSAESKQELLALPVPIVSTSVEGYLEFEATGVDPETGLRWLHLTGASEYIEISTPIPTSPEPVIACLRPLVESYPLEFIGTLSCAGSNVSGVQVTIDHSTNDTDPECALGEADVNRAHMGVCNGPPVIETLEGTAPPGSVTIAEDPLLGSVGIPIEITTEEFPPCGDEPPNPVFEFEFDARSGFTTDVSRAIVFDHNNSSGEILRAELAGEPFDCSSWTSEDGPGTLVFAIPVVDFDTNVIGILDIINVLTVSD
jgi:outer membrane protein assembly factor BamB